MTKRWNTGKPNSQDAAFFAHQNPSYPQTFNLNSCGRDRSRRGGHDLCELYPKPTKPATTPQQQITNIADVMPLVAGEMDIQPESPPDCSEQPDTTSLHPEDDPAPTEDIPPDIGHSTERGHDPLPSSTPPIRHSPYPLRVHGAHFFQLMSKRQKYMSRHPIQMQWNDLCELYPKPTKPATTPQQQITNIADVMPLVAGEMDIQPESPPDCPEQPDTTSLHPEDDPAPTEDIPPDIGHSTERGHDPLPSSTPPIRHSPYPLRPK
ncbi:hypothetical protein DAPPUDRAFT_270600 [Daphnia pulex]|uniref:Uncharacterized protein n=1 Tax=Daphnia pulex TaxID=6669 RepID=E9I0Z9_DAPPU|nr:hypothetical protein DAPPUDRAFT_270600 [Daphnia pulex]|eukprot:EFX62332.1 hypothetical protein DAPPUDRAFT_270600 [Daphnia pulex]